MYLNQEPDAVIDLDRTYYVAITSQNIEAGNPVENQGIWICTFRDLWKLKIHTTFWSDYTEVLHDHSRYTNASPGFTKSPSTTRTPTTRLPLIPSPAGTNTF